VVMDVCAYATMFEDPRQGPYGHSLGLERWTIDPVAKTVARRTINSAPQDFPRPDERRFAQPYRYLYAMALPETQESAVIGATMLYKHDLETGRREVHDFGTGRYPGEFVFVPAHEQAGEDEGWLVGLVVDLPHETTDLVILDARAFEGEPVASVRIPHRVPPGFHGNWVGR
jgi:carotenoid cleavage dioxygenase-like enzyme